MTEPTLRAWGIPYEVMRDEEDPEPLEKAWKRAREEERPVAVLLDL
jgi:sulfopyruvate decarboxylase TPP-binding subunit